MLQYEVISGISLFWILLHLVKRRLSARFEGLNVGFCWLRWSTQRYNDLASSIIGRKVPSKLSLIYDIGALCAVFVSFGSMVFLLFLALQLFYNTVTNASSEALIAHAYTYYKKRQFGTELALPVSHSVQAQGLALTPLVPGITTPISLLPSFLVALWTSGAFHEAGHAICAAISHLRIDSAGLLLFLLFPGAFVSLPAEAYSTASSHHRLRIWTGGISHNLVLALIAFCVSASGFGLLESIQSRTFWVNRGQEGVIVQLVSPKSTLHHYLKPKDVLLSIDDVDLRDKNLIPWKAYLSAPVEQRPTYQNLGWCVEQAWFRTRAQDCCNSQTTEAKAEANCFAQIQDQRNQGCLDRHQIFSLNQGSFQRCIDECNSPSAICIWPLLSQPITRLVYRPAESSSSEMIVFGGSKRALSSQLIGGVLAPKGRWVPSSHHFEAFLEYLNSISLGMAFLNALPIYHLDGSEMLVAVEGMFLELDLHLPNGNIKDSQDVTRRCLIALTSVPGVRNAFHYLFHRNLEITRRTFTVLLACTFLASFATLFTSG